MCARCSKCFRAKEFCLCDCIKEFDSGIKFVFLMHPKEYKRQRTGTGLLAKNSLCGSEIIVGVDFTQNERLKALLEDKSYYPVLMYPSEDSWNASRPGFKETVAGRKLLALIIDSTWFCSKKLSSTARTFCGFQNLVFRAITGQFLLSKENRVRNAFPQSKLAIT